MEAVKKVPTSISMIQAEESCEMSINSHRTGDAMTKKRKKLKILFVH